MPDRIAELLPQLEMPRLPELDLGDGLQMPRYDGWSLLNVANSVCQMFGIPALSPHPALDSQLTAHLGTDIQRVILILVDGLALHRLQRWMQNGDGQTWRDLAGQGILAPITSITPSTTSAALTSLWTGRSANEHGIIGYEMWLKEYGVVANMIQHSPIGFQHSAGLLSRAGFKAAEYLPFPTLGQHLRAHEIDSIAFQHQTIANSGLSQMLFRSTLVHSYRSSADLWSSVRRAIESKPWQRQFLWAYWSEVDYLSHAHGPDAEHPANDFAALTRDFQNILLNRLNPKLHAGTAILLLGDHGQVSTPPDDFYLLGSHPGLERRLHIKPTGENRLMYLFIKPGQVEAVRDTIQRDFLGQFRTIDSIYLAGSGLLGPGQAHPALLDRMGDLAVIPGGNGYLWWADKENPLHGRHGGLHPEEMRVPWLAARLGKSNE